MKEKKQVTAFCKGFRYSGTLISEDSLIYTIDDYKEGIIKLPKQDTILKEGRR